MSRLNENNNPNYGAMGAALPPPPYPGPPPQPHRFFIALVTFLITLGLCLSTLPLKYCDDPLDPQVRERIRGEWVKEVLEHEKQVVDREIVKAQWAWEGQRHTALLHEWEDERASHEQELEERARREEEERKLVRERWALEDQRHTALLHEWENERAHHKQELKERARREEEERKRLDLFWGRVEAHQCKTYGTRECTAVLMNLPAGVEWRVQACKATPLEVHGILRYPKSCEDRRGAMFGLWEIDQYEPDCNTFWNRYKEWGCTSNGSGKRRIEHYLENLPKGGDWREFCATTPIRFRGMEFSGAHECFQYKQGTYGLWDIDDNSC